MAKEGGWIFISHSHLDIKIVRKIRNKLEEQGYEPLMFYLKCLNDDNEIESLIKREIDEREWFIYVDSKNAANSRWVQTERQYISQLKDKKIFTININDDIIKQIDNITSQLKVYISYSGRDKYLYDKIKLALLEKDFLVLDNESMSGDIVSSIKNQIDQTVRNGFVLLLVTKNSIKSEWIKREIEYAKISGGKIIPIYVGDATLDKALSFHLGEVQGVHLDEMPSQEQIKKIILEIQHHIKYYKSDFSISNGFQGAKTIKYPFVASIPDYTFYDCDNLETVYIPSCVSYISDLAFRNDQDVLVICQKNSYAEYYCIRNKIKYKIEN